MNFTIAVGEMLVLRLTITFLVALAFSAVASAQEHHLSLIRGSAEQFRHTALVPTRYFLYSREFGSRLATVPILREVLDVEVPPTEAADAVLYMVQATQGESELARISALLLTDSGKQMRKLPIDLEKLDLRDSVGMDARIRIYYTKVPASKLPQRIRVQSERKGVTVDSIYPMEQELVLPSNVPVDKSVLVIRMDDQSNAPLKIESEGFSESVASDRFGHRKFTFTLKEKWAGNALGKSLRAAPRLVASFKDWGAIANSHAQGYLQELRKNTALNPTDLKISPDLITQKSPENTRRIAYEIFKWIGRNLSYRALTWVIDRQLKINPKPINQTLEDRNGDCKALALLYIKALSSAGVVAEPVEVKLAEGYGPIPIDSQVPRDFQFNHVIVFIPELNEYFDPTSSKPEDLSLTFFGSGTSAFSNSYGLHLFSKQLRLIRPGLSYKDMRIRTVIRKDQGTWVGETEWIGRNGSLSTLALINSRRDQSLRDGKSYDGPFLKNGLELMPATWAFSRDDLHGIGSIRFTYRFKDAPVRSDGTLALIPRTMMASALLKYEELDELQVFGDYCFGGNRSEESIEIKGVRKVQLPSGMTNVNLNGVHSEFWQRIEQVDDRLTLSRQYSSDGNCILYSRDEATQQHAFFKKVKLLTAATHGTIN